MNEEDKLAAYLLLRSVDRKLARKFQRLMFQKAFIDHDYEAWRQRMRKFKTEVEVRQLGLEIEVWNEKAQAEADSNE